MKLCALCGEFYITLKYCATASAQRSPSTPAETMPPAYPAPSPQGKSPLMVTCCSVSLSLTMRTGADVRVSIPIMQASLVRKPCELRPNCWKPLLKRSLMKSGIQKCRGEETNPGLYDEAGRLVRKQIQQTSF